MKDFFAKCGCNCGHCLAFKANSRTDEDRQRCSDGWHKYFGVKLRPDLCYCQGCQSPEPWKSGAVLPDRACNVRPCALKTGVETCAHCPSYPCEELKIRTPGEDFREILEQRTGGPMPEEDYVAFVKPYEGLKRLAEMRASLNQEDIVDKPNVPPIRARIVKFPDDLPLSKKDTEAFRALHGLFVKVLSAPADILARQIIIKRARKNFLNLLWVFGRFSELKKGQLVVDGGVHGSRDDLRNIVRKRDNTLHVPMRLAARILQNWGVHFEHVPVKKEYLLKMSFDKSAGGVDAMKALRRYTTTLVEKHGEPKYAGASRFKGDAYAQFSKADMRVMKGD